ncbi:MAG: hypothetical protein JRF63_08360, partial [Deltaproteobacteria bacterium]|nr:hypothetical protein [Deltaproteobacteria bacterium]
MIKPMLVAMFVAVLLSACGAGQDPAGDAAPKGNQVVFSVANKDRSAPVTVIRVEVNDDTLIYGA